MLQILRMNYLVFLIINAILLSNSEQHILNNNTWVEVNETVILECSLTIKDNEHVSNFGYSIKVCFVILFTK
jgi:hypothetical protein